MASPNNNPVPGKVDLRPDSATDCLLAHLLAAEMLAAYQDIKGYQGHPYTAHLLHH